MAADFVKEDEIIQVRRNLWADNFFRPLIIIVMIMCINVSVVNLVWMFNPHWRATYFLLGMLLTTVEAVYSYRVAQHIRMRHVSVFQYRLTEMAILVLLLKLLSYLGQPWGSISADLQLIWGNPEVFLEAFFTNEFLTVLLLAFTAWSAATFTIADIETLYDPYIDNRMTLDDLAHRFFWGGGILVVVSGITQWAARLDATPVPDLYRPPVYGTVANVMLYFMLGLVLLSQVNLTRLMVRWRVNKIPVAHGLTKQWAKYGVLLLAILTVIAFVLPTGYTLGLLETAAIAIHFFVAIIMFIFQLFIWLVTAPFLWIMSFFAASHPPEAIDPAQPLLPPPPEQTASTAPPWLEILRSIIFWLVALAALGYLIKSYLDDRPELLKHLKQIKLFALVAAAFSQLWKALSRWASAGLELLPNPKKALITVQKLAPTGGESWLRLRRASPRERILRYYLNILQRAQAKGTARNKNQTPYEYQPNLTESAPDVQPEIQELTDAFVHARYSRQEFDKTHVAVVKRTWQQIKNALRRKA